MNKFVIGLILSILTLPIMSNAETGDNLERAIFAGGCFWCMQPPFDATKGVIRTTVGYTGGRVSNPTYEQVSHEDTGHLESIEVTFDPSVVSYEELLDIYWHNVDPLDAGGQFCDRGDSYKTAIFYLNEYQRAGALKSMEKVQEILKEAVKTKVISASTFYKAEEYHQDYYKKNPIRYKFYRYACGRDNRLNMVWGESSH